MTNGLTMSEEEFERPKLEPKGSAYQLAESWHTDCKGCLAHKMHVASGFLTDGASIPRFLWRVCGTPMDVPRIYAAIVHDWLYAGGGGYTDQDNVWHTLTRGECDALYRDYQIAMGISKFKAYTEYYAIRAFGGSHWYN